MDFIATGGKNQRIHEEGVAKDGRIVAGAKTNFHHTEPHPSGVYQ